MNPTILIVDDEKPIADLYATWIEDYETLLAYDGETALELLEKHDVDILFLDRHMPDLTGDEVLAEMEDRGMDCWVAMVTAVEPDFDVLELPVNNYVVKPVSRVQLNRLVETIRIRLAVGEQREHVTLMNKLDTVESRFDRETLRKNEQYKEAIEELREIADRIAGDRETA